MLDDCVTALAKQESLGYGGEFEGGVENIYFACATTFSSGKKTQCRNLYMSPFGLFNG
jgi:hypothetical protein